ncbi:MAG: hypothetical protein H7096_05550 [Flavobacterium sp.]|nr:hypothetical protein [Pedobacter sp.]
MIKTSTQSVHPLIKETVFPDELGEDELKFYSSIKHDLEKLKLKPKNSIIDYLLYYSRSL